MTSYETIQEKIEYLGAQTDDESITPTMLSEVLTLLNQRIGQTPVETTTTTTEPVETTTTTTEPVETTTTTTEPVGIKLQ